MPERYEAIRDEFVRKGKPLKEAKTMAAKIYNATKKKGEPKLNPKHKGKDIGDF